MTGFAIVFQSTFYHTACQLGAIGNAKIHAPATDRRMAVGGIAHQELGMKVLDRVCDDLEEMIKVEIVPQTEGRLMTMVLAPK